MEKNEQDDQDHVVYLEIVSNPALAERLRNELGTLRERIQSEGKHVDVGEPAPGGLKAIDPITAAILIAVAKAAAGAVAAKISVDLYEWIKSQALSLPEKDRPEVVTARVGGAEIPIPIANSSNLPAEALKAVENGIMSAPKD